MIFNLWNEIQNKVLKLVWKYLHDPATSSLFAFLHLESNRIISDTHRITLAKVLELVKTPASKAIQFDLTQWNFAGTANHLHAYEAEGSCPPRTSKCILGFISPALLLLLWVTHRLYIGTVNKGKDREKNSYAFRFHVADWNSEEWSSSPHSVSFPEIVRAILSAFYLCYSSIK